jgi:hemerythrin superfamily protein
MPDALQLLADDHREVSDLFGEMGATAEPKQRKLIVTRIVHALSQHAAAEEELFYPVVAERAVEGAGFVTVSLEEHHKAKVQLRKLEKMKSDDPLFDPSVGELQKEVSVHIADEELQLFPRVRAAFSDDELAELGQKLEARKAEAAAKASRKGAAKRP